MERKSPDSLKKTDVPLKKTTENEDFSVAQQENQYLTRCTRFRLSTEYELSICNCKHVLRMTIGERHSVVNPQRWLCNVCYTTESVWACLSCPNVACGRFIHEHALNHYLDSRHPLVIDVNELYVYCYDCEEYVLNDNKSGDIKVLRETLQAIRYQNFTGTTRSGHTLRTASISADEDVQMRRKLQQQQLDRDDRLFTAIWHARFVRQRKIFRSWVNYVRKKRNNNHESDSENSSDIECASSNLTDQKLRIKLQDYVAMPASLEPSVVLQKHILVSDNGHLLDVEKHDTEILVEVTQNKDNKDFSEKVSDENIQVRQETEEQDVTTQLSNECNESEDIKKHLISEQVEVNVDLKEHPLKGNENADSSNQSPTTGDCDSKAQDIETKDSVAKPTMPVSSPSPRPKRANAASRYKEIMTRLSQNSEPAKKRQCLTEDKKPDGSKSLDFKEPQVVRRSLRILRKEEKEKMVLKRKKKKHQKSPVKASNKVKRKAKCPSVRKILPPRSRICRRVTSESGSKSLYDCVPNRAVASLIPGVTGLRNLGNTCYLNSIIQVLGHLQKFRLCLHAIRDIELDNDPALVYHAQPVSPASKFRIAGRRSTVEMYENQSTTASKKLLKLQAGLNGGHETGDNKRNNESSFNPHQIYNDSAQNPLSLCHELHDLYHIMWSGKWKLVSPYHFLSSVWQLIPSFRGYSQQDAQEFLCELLDKIVSELERRHLAPMNSPSKLSQRISRVVHTVFEGRLHSKVRCLECKHVSSTIEPFWDLSLEFPQRYHTSNTNWKNQTKSCSLLEMLDKFTEAEKLDGGKVYNCSHCNGNHLSQGGTSRNSKARRLSYRKGSQKLTEAEKQIKVTELPQILRFHLKRFRWSGRNHREKITVPVLFPPELDMRPHCWVNDTKAVSSSEAPPSDSFMYDLSAVVIHHGRGFGSGHYTAYCWNDVGKFWVHCNDSNLELCSIDDVMESQAYILFYSQRGLDPLPHIFSPPPTPDMSPPSSPSFNFKEEQPSET